MSQMTLVQIRTNVRDEILEPVAGFWSDADLNRYINTGKTVLASALDIVGAPQSFNCVAGQDVYPFPSGVLQLRRVEVNGYKCDPATVSVRDQGIQSVVGSGQPATMQQGQPYRFYTLGFNYYLFPTPDQAYSGLLWPVSWVADLVNDSDIPTLIPSDFHGLLVDYAVAEALSKADDPNAATYMNRFNSMVSELKAIRSAPIMANDVIEEWP